MAQFAVLDVVPEEERTRVLATARRRRFDKGEVVFHRGDPADALHLVERGRFSVRVVTPLGDTAMLTVVKPGDMFGELALLRPDAERSATVAALERSETWALRYTEFQSLARRHPEVWHAMTLILHEQVGRLTVRLVEALHLPAELRVMRRVRELAEAYADEPGGPVEIPLTQEDLAALAGTSRATVNRVLREAEKEGTVELRRGKTVIPDPSRLERRPRVR